jgi:hypothetical protein
LSPGSFSREQGGIIAAIGESGNQSGGNTHAFLKVAKGLKKKAIFGKFGVSAPNQNRGRPTWSLTQKLPSQTLPNSQGRR